VSKHFREQEVLSRLLSLGRYAVGKLGENDDEPLGFDWGYDVFRHTYPLVMTNSLLLKMVIYSGFIH